MPLLTKIEFALLRQHLVRVGLFGQVGRFAPVEAGSLPRGARVICRTRRGLEVGEVLSAVEANTLEADGTLLRRVTVEDDLLLARLERDKNNAFAACVAKLESAGLDAILMDVEHLFDGQSLFFYFLGEPPTNVESVIYELAETYEAKIQFRQFADTLSEGCGPDCGTEAAAGQSCGTNGCSTCAVLSACKASGK